MENSEMHKSRRMLKVFVIGDTHAALAEAQMALRWEPTLKVTLITDCFEHLSRSFGAEQPDVFVLTNAQPGQALQQQLTRLSTIFRQPRVVLVYKSQPVPMTRELLRLGAKGVMAFTAIKRQLLRSVLAVAQGELWLGRSDMARIIEEQHQSAIPAAAHTPTEEAIAALLTQGEQRIMAYVVKGMTNKEIARVLGISDKTVKTHISHILKKFGVSRRQQMIFGMTGYYQNSAGSRIDARNAATLDTTV